MANPLPQLVENVHWTRDFLQSEQREEGPGSSGETNPGPWLLTRRQVSSQVQLAVSMDRVIQIFRYPSCSTGFDAVCRISNTSDHLFQSNLTIKLSINLRKSFGFRKYLFTIATILFANVRAEFIGKNMCKLSAKIQNKSRIVDPHDYDHQRRRCTVRRGRDAFPDIKTDYEFSGGE